MRIGPRPLGDYPWYLRPLFRAQSRRYGAVLDSALLWARSPKLFFALSLLYGMLDRKSSPLDPALRALVQVRVSQLNSCRFCTDINAATLLERGMPVAKLESLPVFHESVLFDERERLVLTYTEAMTLSDRRVDDELVKQLKRHFDEDAMIELTALIAFQNMSSKFNTALDVPPQGFCAIANWSPTGRERAAPDGPTAL